MEEEEENLSKEEQDLFYEVLFKRLLDIMRKPEMDLDPFREMINRLSVLAGIFSFRAMVSLIPELVAFAIRYGMELEKAYEEEQLTLEEDIQGFDQEGQEKRISRIQKDIDKLNIYL
ncbi:MAG: hypothetical protein HWN81_03030 [Candidatus Lokiarchaeota archaeon]|nr:hypothetical protein [Candidatus Lokiarchaeota archaeon]